MNKMNFSTRLLPVLGLFLIAVSSAQAKPDETIVTGGDVVEVNGKSVKKIPANKAPQQLRDAMNNSSFTNPNH